MCSGLLEREEKSASAFAEKVPLWKGSWCSESHDSSLRCVAGALGSSVTLWFQYSSKYRDSMAGSHRRDG